MKNTGVMCMVYVDDRRIDMGNYFINEKGVKCLITSRELAEKYNNLVLCPIYVRIEKKTNKEIKEIFNGNDLV